MTSLKNVCFAEAKRVRREMYFVKLTLTREAHAYAIKPLSFFQRATCLDRGNLVNGLGVDAGARFFSTSESLLAG